jgi:hypothetical protein
VRTRHAASAGSHRDEGNIVAVSRIAAPPDDECIATASWSYLVGIDNATIGECLRSAAGYETGLYCLAACFGVVVCASGYLSDSLCAGLRQPVLCSLPHALKVELGPWRPLAPAGFVGRLGNNWLCFAHNCGRDLSQIGEVESAPAGCTSDFVLHEIRVAIASADATVAVWNGDSQPWSFRPWSYDQFAAPGASTLELLQMLSIRIAERACCNPGAALRQLFRGVSYSFCSNQARAVRTRQASTVASQPPCMHP